MWNGDENVTGEKQLLIYSVCKMHHMLSSLPATLRTLYTVCRHSIQYVTLFQVEGRSVEIIAVEDTDSNSTLE